MTIHDLVVLPVYNGETDYLGLLSEDCLCRSTLGYSLLCSVFVFALLNA